MIQLLSFQRLQCNSHTNFCGDDCSWNINAFEQSKPKKKIFKALSNTRRAREILSEKMPVTKRGPIETALEVLYYIDEKGGSYKMGYN